MYICSECGNEYEIKPKYCDCGNDIFINSEKVQDEIPQDEILQDEAEQFEDDFEDEELTTERHRNFRKRTSSPTGLAVFVLCIILSLLVLFVIGNPKKDKNVQEITQEVNEKIEIPAIDSYWDNTPVKIAQKEEAVPEQKEENILDKIVQQIIPQEQPKKEIPTAATISVTAPKATQTNKLQSKPKPITSSTTVQPKKTTQSLSKNSSSQQSGMTFEDLTNKIRNQNFNQSQQTTSTQKVQTSTTTQNVPAKSAPLPTQTTQTQTKTTTQSSTITNNNTSQSASTVNNVKSAAPVVQNTPAKSQAQLQQELVSYKAGLRNTIGHKIDFTKVIGDGECSLSFKLNSNGRLISKAFTKQSSNITLNDAAFNALNTTTSYSSPPEGYKGETLKLIIKFYNGNFEISLN